jgi:hypothetical protein
MKIRSGFVSNSSSSSFVLVVSNKVFNEVYQTLSPFEKDLITWIAQDANIDDMCVKVIEGCSGEWGSTTDNYEVGDGNTNYVEGTDPTEEDSYEELLDEIVEKLREGSKHFYNSQTF